MVKRSASKKSKQSHKTHHKKESHKKMRIGGKRQLSGYLMFCAEQRAHRKNEFEKMKPKEIMQHLGAQWRKLSSQQQEAYKTKAPANKTHHETLDKDESKQQKSHTHAKSIHDQSGTKSKGNKIHHHHNHHQSKSATKKKRSVKSNEHAHEKSVARKIAHHHENTSENGVNSSE